MRLIDADATLDLLKSLGSRDYRRSKGTIAEAEKMLMHEEYTPTIDAELVRHGHWERIKYVERDWMRCSACEENIWTAGEFAELGCLERFCPNCGAKMFRGSNEE